MSFAEELGKFLADPEVKKSTAAIAAAWPKISADLVEVARIRRWRKTYNEALQAAFKVSACSVSYDSATAIHNFASKLADLAHGPLKKETV